jgi:hypothetical protein
MKSLIKIIFLFGFVFVIQSQSMSQPSKTWQRLYNKSARDNGYAVCKADGNNFI